MSDGPSHMQVMLYVPNLIGYFRFLLTFMCVKYAFDAAEGNWIMFTVCYSCSQLLDAIDGFAARKLNQCSKFGACLDMISDRTSCSTIYMLLATIYPEPIFSYCFLMCMVLDFGSHYL